ncbi:transposase [Methanobrevibacter curvatus]|uniref:Transposase IS4-like domain-containing protein n=1 Tax=Methanobrevibacter curvatus TaxID=49547 RepID=A0A165ZJN9_9EURY|nr:transposase [Methanobrevibacter curvatus]KZX10814.1 hypothetical protein MBCUR_16640 [Methanobrevibacter curvatus]
MLKSYLTILKNLIKNERETFVLEKNKFTRNHKMSFEDVVYYILGNKGKTIVLEIEDYFNEKFGDDEIPISKQALSERRSFLDWKIFKRTDTDALTDFYSTKSDYLEDFKEYYVLTIDGSPVDLPNAKITREEFGVQLRALKEAESPKARISTLCDVKNDFIIDSTISPMSIGEHTLAQENIEKSSKTIDLKKAIIIFDRLYPSTELYLKLIEKESKFIFRLKKTDYIHEKKYMKTDDEYTDIKLNATRTQSIKNNQLKEKTKEIKSLNLRIVNVKQKQEKLKH